MTSSYPVVERQDLRWELGLLSFLVAVFQCCYSRTEVGEGIISSLKSAGFEQISDSFLFSFGHTSYN